MTSMEKAMEKAIMAEHQDMIVPSEFLDAVTTEALGDALPKNYYRSPQFVLSFVSMAIAYQAAFLGYVMSANVITIINQDLGPNHNYILILLVYVLCQTVTFTVSGRLSDIFGRRWFFIGANTLAFIGYIINGRGNSINMLIGGSVIAGIGTGVQQTMPVIFGELVPNSRRNLALGITFAFLAPLAVIGPGLARIMVDNASWRWVYYMVAIFSAVSGLLQVFFYFPPRFHQLHTVLSKRKALMELDFGGLLLFAGSATSFILGISWGGREHPWKSTHVIGSICAGGVGFILFILWERLVPLKEPLMPLYLFRNRNYVCLMIVSSVGSMIFYALNIVYPQQIAAVYGKSIQTTGWMSCTIVAGAIFGQFLGAFSNTYHRLVSVKWQLVLVCVIFTAFTGGMAAVSSTNVARPVVFSLLSSTMIGYMEVITLAGAPLMLEAKDLGLANGVEYTVRSGASVLADSIYVTILDNRLTSNLIRYVVPAIIQAGLPAGSVASFLEALATGNQAVLLKVPGTTEAVIEAALPELLLSYENAFQLIYLVSIAFGGCSIIAALLVSGPKLEERMTNEVARKLQKVNDFPVHYQAKTSDTEMLEQNN